MSAAHQKSEMISSGVQNLIQNIRQDGVERGKTEAEKIVADAKKQAEKQLADAKKQADAYFEKKQAEIKAMEEAAAEDIKSVYRDSLLKMKEHLSLQFTKKIQGLVSNAALDEDILTQMVMEVTHKQAAKTKGKKASELAILLPKEAVSLNELRQDPELLAKDDLGKLVTAATASLLKKGVTFMASEKFKAGIKVQLKDEKVELDITDQALTEIFMEHLQPRFRAILEGAAK